MLNQHLQKQLEKINHDEFMWIYGLNGSISEILKLVRHVETVFLSKSGNLSLTF
jgi:hypothetical protein